ncbi:permease [Ochrobactrum sp. XJ1]|nr:permease [Ochrobactrum sp. XJ1]
MSFETLPTRPVICGRFVHLLIVYVVWGSTYFAVKLAIGNGSLVTPLQLQTWRMWSAGALLLAVAFVKMRTFPRIQARHIHLCVVSGIAMWVFGNGLATLASTTAASVFIVMAMGMIPIWTTLFTALTDKKMPSTRVLTGLLMGISGLILVFGSPIYDRQASADVTAHNWWNVLILTGAATTWSLGTLAQRPLLSVISPLWAAPFQMLIAALILTGLCAWEGQSLVPPADVDADQILAFLYLVVYGSAVCLISYMQVLVSFSPTIASTFAYVNPIVGIALGWAFLHETPTLLALGGAAIILFGVFLILRREPTSLRRRQSEG